MGIFEVLQQKKGTATAGALLLILLAAAAMAYQFLPGKRYSQSTAYFSDDDGKTWFLDNADRVPPYDHDGKQAVRATIYSYDNGSKQFCGCLMRFGPAAHKLVEAAIANGARKTPPESAQSIMFGQDFANSAEVKKPNSSDPWISVTSRKAQAVLVVKSPDDSVLDTVLP